MNLWDAVLIFLSGLYIVMLGAVYVSLSRLRRAERTRKPFTTIVVAARDEGERIEHCLEGLGRLTYPRDKYEVILIDDASTDDTGAKIAEYSAKHDNWDAIYIKEKSSEMPGKVNALAQATRKARGELVFATDADCQVPPEWLTVMVRYFVDDVVMVTGYSPLARGQGLLHRFLEFENLVSAISMAAFTKLGFPCSSTGRNLAYRLDALMRAGGYASIRKFRSGDDTHLTDRFRRLKLGKVDFCADPETFVRTLPLYGWRDLFHQHVRKRSKVFRKSGASVVLTVVVFLAYMAGWAAPLASPSDASLWWVTLLVVRFASEFACLSRAAVIFEQRQLIKFAPIMQIILPFHVVFFSLLGIFKTYRWKK